MPTTHESVPAPAVSRAFTPAAAELPPNVDVGKIVAQLRADHVSAPAATHDELVALTREARDHGINLSIVVIDRNPRRDADLRDLATTVGKQEHGTVVVFSPDWVGTYSDSISRVRLEKAEDPAKNHGGNTELSANNFVHTLIGPTLPWTALSCAVFAAAIAATGGLYWVKVRRAKRAKPQPPAQQTNTEQADAVAPRQSDPALR
ncbi:DUF6676 family protein [Skermania sp. ID1734]|uniref:Rv1476 family membrane protein n=1 Tax=Skermania sp. ID1734 TaxID=2597516 RepID=UPI00163D7D25|nr:DUF6676 family protein [Skermania sp. ID1734]